MEWETIEWVTSKVFYENIVLLTQSQIVTMHLLFHPSLSRPSTLHLNEKELFEEMLNKDGMQRFSIIVMNIFTILLLLSNPFLLC